MFDLSYSQLKKTSNAKRRRSKILVKPKTEMEKQVKIIGTSLIEMLIALLVLSFGLLSISYMQINALHWTKKAEAFAFALNAENAKREASYK